MNPKRNRLTLIPMFMFLAMVFILFGCGSDSNESDDASAEEAFYPIDFCIVSGNDFNEVGSSMIPYTHVHEGTTIKFCCKPCLPKFQKNPEKYLVILQEEMDALEVPQPAG
jgi:YHS domain-containing protein